MQDGETDRLPMTDVEAYLTPEQVKQLIDAAPDIRWKVFFHTLFWTGRRVSELVGGKIYSNKPPYELKEELPGLCPADIDPVNNMIAFTILKKKIRRKYWIPVKKEVINNLMLYVTMKNIGPHERIFPFTRQRADQVIKKIGQKIGIVSLGSKNKPLHCHVLRHSFAIHCSRIAENPAQLQQLSHILKHSSIAITEAYLKEFNPKTDRELVDKL